MQQLSFKMMTVFTQDGACSDIARLFEVARVNDLLPLNEKNWYELEDILNGAGCTRPGLRLQVEWHRGELISVGSFRYEKVKDEHHFTWDGPDIHRALGAKPFKVFNSDLNLIRTETECVHVVKSVFETRSTAVQDGLWPRITQEVKDSRGRIIEMVTADKEVGYFKYEGDSYLPKSMHILERAMMTYTYDADNLFQPTKNIRLL